MQRRTIMPLVAAKCTSCGASLTVDSSKEAAICEFCGTPFIVEKAITNITMNGNNNITVSSAVINIQNGNSTPSIDNMLKRAKEFEQQGNYATALDYCNKVLDLDVSNASARDIIRSINDKLHNIPLTIPVLSGLFSSSTLTLTRECLTYTTKKGETAYPIDSIVKVKRFDAKLTIITSNPAAKLRLSTGNINNAALMERAINYLQTAE